jgi:UbiD family decarboxylase
MYFKDFRDYLDNLERQGMLLRVTKEVSPRFEMAAGIYKAGKTNGPALLFENVKDCSGWKVAGGLFMSQKLLSFALQTDESKLLDLYLELGEKRTNSVLVPSGPVKEVIIKGEEVDLLKLPFLTHCEKDELPYHHSGVNIARHPNTGIQNASIHRMSILGKDMMGLGATPEGHLGLMIREAEEQGQSLGIATAIGVHPALIITSSARVPIGLDEVEIAGALRGKAFEMVKCETIDAHVPADAEVVIEGVIVPNERVAEGAWGGERGNYILLDAFYKPNSSGKLVKEIYKLKVTAITTRQNPIYLAMTSGFVPSEEKIITKWNYSASIYKVLTGLVLFPEDIRGINVILGTHVVISINKRDESTPRDIIYAVLAAMKNIKRVVLVDGDIDIYDPIEVEWAILARVTPGKDVIIIPSTKGLPTFDKWGIDATAPLSGEPFGQHWLFNKAVPPGVNEVDYV